MAAEASAARQWRRRQWRVTAAEAAVVVEMAVELVAGVWQQAWVCNMTPCMAVGVVGGVSETPSSYMTYCVSVGEAVGRRLCPQV